MELYRFKVTGKVQGVYYRKFVSQAAMRGRYRGTVRNMRDGSVEVIAELIDDEFEPFMGILREGSPASIVDGIEYEVIDDAPLEYDGFVIVY